MALFGAQLIYTIVMFLLLSRLGKFYSLGRYLLCSRLHRYVCPGTEDLKKSVRNHYKSNKKRNRHDNDEKEEFNIPETVSLEVGLAPVKEYDLLYIKFTDDFQSFIDVSLITLIIYLSTEVYYAFFRPYNEINLSLLWLFTILLYGFITLTKITLNYMRSDEGSLCIIFAGLSFIASLLVQLGDSKLFELNLKTTYSNLTENFYELIDNYTTHLKAFADDNNNNETVTASNHEARHINYYNNQLMWSCIMAILSSYIGALLVFPSLRLAKLHLLCLKSSAESRAKKLILYVNFLLPLFITTLWFKASVPTTAGEQRTSTRIMIYMFGSSSLKLVLIAALFLIRLVLYRVYAQAYLNTAYDQAVFLRQRSTKITNVQFQNTIISIYKYYGVVANQYLLPTFFLLFLTFLMKTLGDLTWCDLTACENTNQNIVSLLQRYSIVANETQQEARQSFQLFKQLESGAFNMTGSYISFRSVFTTPILRSLLGYLTFWTCFSSFSFSCIGLLYYQYMDRAVIQE